MSHCYTCTCPPDTVRPEGCICDPMEWGNGDLVRLPDICDSHKGDPKKNCAQCEHDFECHRKGTA